jgi:hypothetical protein
MLTTNSGRNQKNQKIIFNATKRFSFLNKSKLWARQLIRFNSYSKSDESIIVINSSLNNTKQINTDESGYLVPLCNFTNKKVKTTTTTTFQNVNKRGINLMRSFSARSTSTAASFHSFSQKKRQTICENDIESSSSSTDKQKMVKH